MENIKKNFKISNVKADKDHMCEICRKIHTSVRQNRILTGFKECESCRISKTLFPV